MHPHTAVELPSPPVLRFERPEFFWLLLMLVPVCALAWRGRAFEGSARWFASLAFRVLVVLAMVTALAEPAVERRSDAVATAFILDRSGSIPAPLRAESQRFVEALIEAKSQPDDLYALVHVGREAEIATTPRRTGPLVVAEYSGARDGTNLAAGIQRAISILPPNATKRVVLLSDGNENIGSVLAEADAAAARGVPIDVVPLDFTAENEVVIESLRAPARARPGQPIDLRLTIRSQREATGTVFLREGGALVDLDPDADGYGLSVSLRSGVDTLILPFPLADGGTHRFEAIFEPDDPAMDRLAENNRGTAVTTVDGPGRVLVVDPSGGAESAPLIAALQQASIAAIAVHPDNLTPDGAFFSGFDCIILVNLPRWQIDGEIDRLLRAYVHDVGGGLLVVGGPSALGAGGWIGSEVAEVLPVELDPPATRSYLRGSIAIVLDASGSMSAHAAGGMIRKQMLANEAAAAGVRSMSPLDEICVIAFTSTPNVLVPRQALGTDLSIERMIRGIASGGGTDLHAAMDAAIRQLDGSTAGTKHMIVLTDGITAGAPQRGLDLAEAARRRGITVSAIGIDEGAQDADLRRITEIAGGRFHPVVDLEGARELPEIFIREFHDFGRRMTVEGSFQPTVLTSAGGPLRGLTAVPALGGYVVTVPRSGLAELHIVQPTSEATDPIFASWNHGLGRAAVFTSDAGARWANAWTTWSEYRAFWEQTTRWLMRPTTPAYASTRTRIDGDTAIVELELTRPDGGFDLTTQPVGTLLAPDGTLRTLALSQVGPGRWRGEFNMDARGTYLTSLALANDSSGRRTSVTSAVSTPYAREYRATEGNRALLEEIASRTGGRVLELDAAPSMIDAFAPPGVAPPATARGLWDILAVLAAVLFLGDMAFRRVIFDWRDLGIATRAGGGVRTPGQAALAAMASVRSGRRDRAVAPDAEPDLSRATAAASVQMTPASVQTATSSPAPVTSSIDASQTAANNSPADDESTASRLLRAKRRVEQDRQDP